MDQPIVFLAPESLAGKTGIQRVDDDTHEVTAVLDDQGNDVSRDGVSYRGADA
jgi:hypothetical protein